MSKKTSKKAAEKTGIVVEEIVEPQVKLNTSLKTAMESNPQGTNCSVCGKPSGADKGVKASVCDKCVAASLTKTEKAAAKTTEKKVATKKAAVKAEGHSRGSGGILAAVEAVLKGVKRDKGLHAKEIAEKITEQGLWTTDSTVTPVHTIVNSSVSGDLHKRGEESRFLKVGPATFALKKVG